MYSAIFHRLHSQNCNRNSRAPTGAVPKTASSSAEIPPTDDGLFCPSTIAAIGCSLLAAESKGTNAHDPSPHAPSLSLLRVARKCHGPGRALAPLHLPSTPAVGTFVIHTRCK